MNTSEFPKHTKVKDGRPVTIRPLGKGDFDALYNFFQDMPAKERDFLRHNVTDKETIRKWTDEPNTDQVYALIAESEGKIVADATLHFQRHGWMPHVAHVRMMTAADWRHIGLGSLILRDLVAEAERQGVEKLQSHVIEENKAAIRAFEKCGFKVAAVLDGLVKDRSGNKQNLVIMINDVEQLHSIIEDWIHDSIPQAFRAGMY